MVKNKTIHTSRTIMFAEFAKIMDYALHDGSFLEALNQNVINKKTNSGINKTTVYLKTLYGFDINLPTFKALKYFWGITDEKEKSILAFLYALGNDYLLAESISVIAEAQIGNKLAVEKFEENIDVFYPNRYSEITRRSIAKNIASSWKQAGFIIGKIKNIRTQPTISYNIVAFAFLMAYLNELRGEFILTSKWVKALCLSESQLRELAIEAAKRDLMQYQYSGSVTAISFNNIIKKLEIDGI